MEIFINENDVYCYENDSGIIKKIYGSLYGEFEINDTVKIVNIGQYYSSYNYMAKAMKIPENKWNIESVETGDIGIIFSRKVHEDKSDILYGVKFKNGIHIFGEDGLELVNKYMAIKKLCNKDFKI